MALGRESKIRKWKDEGWNCSQFVNEIIS
jgi:hypothetical protein